MYSANENELKRQSLTTVPHTLGALDGGPQCRMSNLRNGNVPCRYLCISHVDFKIT